MEDGLSISEYEEASNDTEVYFTINLNHVVAYQNQISTNAEDYNDTLDDQSITTSDDDASIDDRYLMNIVLEDWLVHSIRRSPNQRLTWKEVLSLFRKTKSSLLLSWYMSRGPEGFFSYFTSTLPGSAIICHNFVSYKTSTKQSTPPTTSTRSSNNDDLEHDGNSDTESAAFNSENAAMSSDLVVTKTSSLHFLPRVDTVDRDNNMDHLRTNDNSIPMDSNSKSFGSFITFQSYLDTNSMETSSIQNDFDDYDENFVGICDLHSMENDEVPLANDDQYCNFDEETEGDESSTNPLSPAESPDYKNYSMKEFMLYPESVWCYDLIYNQAKQNLTSWLLNLLRESSSIKLWYDLVAMELETTFGISSTPHLVHWIDKEIADVTISKSNYDGELYVYQTSSHTLLQLVWNDMS